MIELLQKTYGSTQHAALRAVCLRMMAREIIAIDRNWSTVQAARIVLREGGK